MTQKAFFLKSGNYLLTASCFIPDSDIRGSLLFIPPLCEERKGALPIFVQTARVLAKQNFASLIFDLADSGDSCGDFGSVDPAQFETDCETALSWLKAHCGETPIALLGLRTGALLAARIAAQHKEITALIGWSPVTGTAFIRHLLQRRMVNDMVTYGQARTTRAALEATLQNNGAVDLNGYQFTAAHNHWLQQLTPQAVLPPSLWISGGHDAQTCQTLVDLSPGAQHSDVRYPPFWNTIGQVAVDTLISETSNWLHRQFATAQKTTILSLPEKLPSVSPSAELITLGNVNAVSAILDKPAEPPRAGVLFLHGWSGDRSGPHRLFTQFARQLSTKGHLCLRLDFIGRGLSSGAPGEASIARMTENAELGLALLRTRLPSQAPIALVAICSGCKVAITLASAHPELDRLLLWSPESMGSLRSATTSWRKTLNACRTYARKLCHRETWRKLLRGRVQTRLIAKALVQHETRSTAEAAQEEMTLRRFRAFRHPVMMVFGGSDPDAPGSSRAYIKYCRQHRIPCHAVTIAHAGHSYYGAEWTEKLFDISLPFLCC